MRRLLPPLALALSLIAATPAAAAGGPVVAVLDSGVDLGHPALRGKAWRNAGELRNGRDDDGNGYVDDLHGADVVGGDGLPRDPRGHGTHVAGIIARGGGVQIMAVRVIGADGTGSAADLARGIDYAVAKGARVLNLSVAGYGHDPALLAALQRAAAAGAVVVAAAGNDGTDLDREPVYPASYRTPGMLVAAASDASGRLAPWSGHGSESVDLMARGVSVRSALPGRRYGRKSGTSQASAYVSRAAARVVRTLPAASAETVRTALLGPPVTATPRLNLRSALARIAG